MTAEWDYYKSDGDAEIEFGEASPVVTYGESGAMFIRQCPRCARYVAADKRILENPDIGPKNQPNATCSVHGRVKMPFIGYV